MSYKEIEILSEEELVTVYDEEVEASEDDDEENDLDAQQMGENESGDSQKSRELEEEIVAVVTTGKSKNSKEDEESSKGKEREPEETGAMEQNKPSESGVFVQLISESLKEAISLDSVQREGIKLPIFTRLFIACECAKALRALHRLNIPHADFRPANILVHRYYPIPQGFRESW